MRQQRERTQAAVGAFVAAVTVCALLLPVAAQAPKSVPAVGPTAAQVLFLAAAAAPPVVKGKGQLLGYVVDAHGLPQASAVVEVRPAGLRTAPVHQLTSAQGLFRLLDLAPGLYYVQVGKGRHLAALQRVRVHASERALLLVNLPALLQSARFGPPVGISADQAFIWALRQASIWRPILRWDDPAVFAVADRSAPVQGFVALTAGAGDSAFAAPALATAFQMSSLALGSERLSLTGVVGTNGQIGGADTQVTAKLQSADPSNAARMSVSLRQMEIPARSALPALRLLSFNYSNAVNLGEHVRVQFGSMLNAVSLTDTVTTFDPYVRVMAQISPEGVLEYRAISGVPPVRFDADSASMDDPTPRVTLDQGRARPERARHQELRYTESLTPADTVSAAVFQDEYTRTAVNGAFSPSGALPDSAEVQADASLLPDLTSGMFLADGGNYGGWGYRVGLRHRLGNDWRAILGYSDGAVLTPATTNAGARALASDLAAAPAHAVTFKLAGVIPLTHTQLVCSYRALSRLAATGLDQYDDSFTQSRSYANVFLRQPLPGFMSGGGRMAALVEIHNLLAQGYIPVLGSDGQMLFLVQSARSLRGGLTISF